MIKDSTNTFIEISPYKIQETCDAFFKWKDLDAYIRSVSNRGINMPDAISEPMACYCLGLLWNIGPTKGDATDKYKKKIIEFKATSRFEGDLSSFGPDCKFDNIYVLRFNLKENTLYIYNLNMSSEDLATIKVNSHQTFGDQQRQGRRPHISLVDLFIKPRKLEPEVIFDITSRRIVEDNR